MYLHEIGATWGLWGRIQLITIALVLPIFLPNFDQNTTKMKVKKKKRMEEITLIKKIRDFYTSPCFGY